MEKGLLTLSTHGAICPAWLLLLSKISLRTLNEGHMLGKETCFGQMTCETIGLIKTPRLHHHLTDDVLRLLLESPNHVCNAELL